uniref:Phosphoglycerate mutase (2,3-diphosphoglycerate-dependent) n=1 Tax=Haptolina ericina TaxID=156174 RepID=A0A7S3F0X5_9EUKA|mmetsp:Transcript_43905/g.99275  ORF Transcript_43905/g.99275 Transcript_43905/m.99275 type:complete len:250 (+) Transcript_43905:172-921(+)
MRALSLLVVVGAHGLEIPPTPFGARRLILVRHGAVARELHEPPVKPGALYGGNVDVPLSQLGEEEAAAAAAFIETNCFDVRVIFSSPMKRALYGARSVCDVLKPSVVGGLEVCTSSALREIDRGEWTNKTRDEIAAQWGADAFERAAREDEFAGIYGGEGMGQLRERVLGCRDFILKRLQPDMSAVIVSHLWVTRCLLADALGEPDVLNVDVPTASISIIDYGDGSWPAAVASEQPTVVLSGFEPPLPE